jgi:AraC family transcriptional regulator, transcriptional activator of pobA
MTELKGIPDYFVYGEPVRALDLDFMHVELVSTRNSVHRGEVAAHKHPQLAQITLWLEGSGTYHIEHQSWTFQAPAVSYIPSGVVHGFTVIEGSDAIVLSIADDPEHSSANPPTIFVQPAPDDQNWPTLRTTMAQLLQEYRENRPLKADVMRHLADLAYCLIQRLNSASIAVNISPEKTLADRLRKRIDVHYRDNWPVTQYISALATTPHLLDKAAKQSFGISVKRLILQRRLLEAKRLLKFTIRSSESIAAELGFEDPAYFNREFKKHTGLAPGTWRKQIR